MDANAEVKPHADDRLRYADRKKLVTVDHKWRVALHRYLAKAVPLMGKQIRFLMLGGNEVNANALLRFYVLHCVGLPLGIAVLMAVHFWRVRKDGGISGPL